MTEALKRSWGRCIHEEGGREGLFPDRHTHTPRVFTDTSTCIHKYYSPKDVECYTCQKVECRAVLGSAQKGSGAAKITFIYIFRAYTESMA